MFRYSLKKTVEKNPDTISKMSVKGCQGQDTFAFGEALTDNGHYPAIFNIVTRNSFPEKSKSHCKYDSYGWVLIIRMSQIFKKPAEILWRVWIFYNAYRILAEKLIIPSSDHRYKINIFNYTVVRLIQGLHVFNIGYLSVYQIV